MNKAMRDRAHKLIKKGYTPVLQAGKRCIQKDWTTMTVTEADVDSWPDSDLNLAVRTGDHGLVVLDFDQTEGYQQFCDAFSVLSDTHTVKTGSGHGYHVYLTCQEGLPKSSGVLKLRDGATVEIKAKGKVVTIPPSIHPDTHQPYKVHVEGAIIPITHFKPIQDWIDQYNQKPAPLPIPMPDVLPQENGRFTAYARAALQRAAGDLAAQREGGRNDLLNRTAWTMAHFVRQGDLSESEVRMNLTSACISNGLWDEDGERAVIKTYESGYRDGYADSTWIPEVYTRPQQSSSRRDSRSSWEAQRRPDRAMPGDWEAYQVTPKMHEEDGVQVIGRTKIIKRSSLFSDLLERIQMDEWIPTDVPIEFPLQSLWHLDGLARISSTGKIMGLVGASGSRKTSCLEMMADAYVKNGTPLWIWTPEWTPTEMAERTLQRMGGPTVTQLRIQDLDKYRVNKLGLPSDPSTRLPDNQWKFSAEQFRIIRSWSQDVHYIHNVLLTINEMEEVFAEAKGIVDPFPQVAMWDYAQLLRANEVEESDEAGIYNMIQRLKVMCERFGLLGWVATQVTKDDARRTSNEGKHFKGSIVMNVVKNSQGHPGFVRLPFNGERALLYDELHLDQEFDPDARYLGAQAGRYVNPDAFNLLITLNPEYNDNSIYASE